MRLQSLIGMGLVSVAAVLGSGVQSASAHPWVRYYAVRPAYVAPVVVTPRVVPAPVVVAPACCHKSFVFTIETKKGIVKTITIDASCLRVATDKLRENHPRARILSVN